jgi:hypothetical protein
MKMATKKKTKAVTPKAAKVPKYYIAATSDNYIDTLVEQCFCIYETPEEAAKELEVDDGETYYLYPVYDDVPVAYTVSRTEPKTIVKKVYGP